MRPSEDKQQQPSIPEGLEEEIDLSEDEQGALDRVWERIRREDEAAKAAGAPPEKS